MTEHHLYFSSFTHVTQSWNVKGVGSKLQSLMVKGKGDVNIKITIGPRMHFSILKHVLYVPGIGVNLFSIGKATHHVVAAILEKDTVHMYRENNLELIGTRTEADLYINSI